MSNTSTSSYRDLLIPHFLDVLKIMDEVLTLREMPYYLIGVNASALRLLEEGIKPARGTKDIDFAVMLSTFNEYQAIKEDLVRKGFTKSKDPFTLFHTQFKVAIDVLPFGPIEEDDTVNFNEQEILMNVLGFKETLSNSEVINLDSTFSIRVPPLHGMVFLKLISWSDRPEVRANDLEDIYRIISHYYEIESDALFEKHSDLLKTEGFDEKLIAARIMGRNIAGILAKSNELKDRVLDVLASNVDAAEKSYIGKYWAARHGIEVDYAIKILTEINQGIIEEIE